MGLREEIDTQHTLRYFRIRRQGEANRERSVHLANCRKVPVLAQLFSTLLPRFHLLPWRGMIESMNPRAFSIPDSHQALGRVRTALSCAILLALGQIAIAQNVRQQQSASEVQRQSAVDGRQAFESTCSGCHGLDGRGGERGPDIGTRQQVVQLSDGELLEILRQGKPAAGMPPFESFGSAKLKAVLVYLRSLQGKGAATVLPGDPQRGKSLFFGEARCAECHMIQGAGGFLGRDLSSYGAALSPTEIRKNILGPGENTNRANKAALITMRDGRKFSGVLRNEDNFSIQLQSLDGAFHFLTRTDVAQLEFLPGTIMPADYGATLKPAELDDLVSYLAAAAKAGIITKKENWKDDE